MPLAPWGFLQTAPNPRCDFSAAEILLWLSSAVLFFVICLLVYAYGFLTFAKNFYTIQRNELKKSRWWKFPAVVGAFDFNLAGMFLLPIVLKKRCWAALIFISGIFVCSFAGYMLDTPLSKWWCLYVGNSFCLLTAMAVIKKGKCSKAFVYPLCGFLLFIATLGIFDFYFDTQIEKKQSELAEVTQCGISRESWQKRNSLGYSVNKEPLKSFCNVDIKINMEKHKSPAEAQKYLAELRKKYADFFVAIDKILTLKPQRIAYNWVKPHETVAALLLPELKGFRWATNLRALEIRANPENKSVVAKCNQDMLKFREWCSHNETLIGKLVAGAIDNIRLRELSYAMASGVYSKEEINKLIGTVPDWSRMYSETFASENAIFEDMINLLKIASEKDVQNLEFSRGMKFLWYCNQKFAPLFIKMNLKREYLWTLNYYLQINSLLCRDDISGLEKREISTITHCHLTAQYFISPMIVIPDLAKLLERIDRTKDLRQMAHLAAEVTEYRRRHGKLPENLSFLPQIPLSKLNHKPLMYEKTAYGFRIFSNTDKGEKPPATDTLYTYQVHLIHSAER